MKDLIFFGIQGSGKGTQGRLVAQNYGYKIFETGAALREIASEDSDLGHTVKNIIESGNLVTNEIVMNVVEDFVNKVKEGEKILFDGIPRSVEQKESFDAVLKKHDREAMGILIDISEEEAKRRLLGRRICSNCKKVYSSKYVEDRCDDCQGSLVKRTDDNEEAILKRIENFKKETVPAIKIYEEEGRMIKVNGQQAIEDVDSDLRKVIDELQ